MRSHADEAIWTHPLAWQRIVRDTTLPCSLDSQAREGWVLVTLRPRLAECGRKAGMAAWSRFTAQHTVKSNTVYPLFATWIRIWECTREAQLRGPMHGPGQLV